MESRKQSENNHTFPDPDSPSPFGMEESNTVTLLNALIEANRDLVSIFKSAAEQLDEDANKGTLHAQIEQCDYATVQLSNLVSEMGGTPEEDGTLGRLFDQAMIQFKGLTNQSDGEILEVAVRNGEDVLRQYSNAMGHPALEEDIRSVFRSQMSSLRIAVDQLRALASAYQD